MDGARRITARQNTEQARLASENGDKLLPLATFKNSLREWQARWRALGAKRSATTDKEPGGTAITPIDNSAAWGLPRSSANRFL